MRETGYYWVKYKDQWFVNYWSGMSWMEYTKKPMAMFFEDFDFTEINETRILNPDEK